MEQKKSVPSVTPVERRIIAAEVALEDHLPAIAGAFLARIEERLLLSSSRVTQARFLRLVRAVKRVPV